MNLIEARIINIVQAKTRYGLKLVLNAELLKFYKDYSEFANQL